MSGVAASSRKLSTRADDGPRRHAAIMAVTACLRACEHRFDAAVAAITHPAFETVRPRRLFDEVSVADTLHPPADRDVADRIAHGFFNPRNALLRAFTSASRIARPVSSDDASPFRLFGEAPSRSAFSVS